jgi:hypothetical protein
MMVKILCVPDDSLMSRLAASVADPGSGAFLTLDPDPIFFRA